VFQGLTAEIKLIKVALTRKIQKMKKKVPVEGNF